MKNVLATMVLCLSFALSASAQTCYTQDTAKIHRQKTRYPTGIVISNRDKLVVTACRTDTFGMRAPVKVWNKRSDFMEGYGANDSFFVTGSHSAAFDTAGNLFVVQTQRSDSNILIYDDTLALIGVIGNTPGLTSWSRPRGIAFDAAQNLYVVSDDSVGPGPLFADIPNTGKLIKITSPLYAPSKSVLLSHLNAPKAISIVGAAVYLTENGDNELARYNLATLVKEDSVVLRNGMDVTSVDCKVYATEHATNQVRIFNSGNLSDASRMDSIATPAGYHGKMGVALDAAKDLFFDINDSNQVVFYRGIVPDPFITSTATFRRFCISSGATFGPDTTGTWYSDDTSTVRVDGSGGLTGYRAGTARIIHVHGISDTFYAMVDTADMGGLGTTYTQRYGTNLYDSAHTCIWYTRQMYNTGAYNYWSSSNPRVAYISWIDGNVWPLDTGAAFIICSKGNSCGFAQDSFKIIVDRDPHVDTIAGPAAFCFNSSAHYSETTPNGRWICDAPGIAVMDSLGNVTGIGVGTATISYKVGNICDSIAAIKTITILHDAIVTDISGPLSACVGTPITFANDSSGGVWSSSNTTVMTISSATPTTAMALPLAAGTTVISYVKTNTCGYDSAGILVMVIDTIPSTFTGRDSICVGDRDTLHPAYGGGTWSTSNAAVASVSVMGEVYGVSAGNAAISYAITSACSNDSNAHNIAVLPILPVSVTITASPADSVRYFGATVTFTAITINGGTAPVYQWYLNGAPVTAATSSTFSTNVYSNDTVWCAVTSNALCITNMNDTSNLIVIYADYLGVHDLNTVQGALTVFPNPNNGAFVLSGNVPGNDNLTIEVRNVTGALVSTATLTPVHGVVNATIHAATDLAPGSYWVRVTSAGFTQTLGFQVQYK